MERVYYLICPSEEAVFSIDLSNDNILPGSIACVIGGHAYMLTPSMQWRYLNEDLQKLLSPVIQVPQSGSSGGDGGGGGSSALIVNATLDQNAMLVFDKTWKQIHDAVKDGTPVLVDAEGELTIFQIGFVSEMYSGADEYRVTVSNETFNAESEDDYPKADFS